eukprot:scaffold5642_cov21-Tisochrysis_lutea.AAC.1
MLYKCAPPTTPKALPCRLWSIATGDCVARFEGHTHWVTSVATGGKLCVSGSADTTVRCVYFSQTNCGTAAIVGVLLPAPSMAAFDFQSLKAQGSGEAQVLGENDSWTASPESKMFEFACRVFDLEAKEHLQTLKGHTDMVTSVAMSADGALCASGSRDNTVRIWDLATGGCQVLEGHSDRVEGVAISGSGKVCVSASADKTF